MREQIGQLLMTGISGISLSSDEKSFLEAHNVGGVIYFSHNFESPAQLAELSNSVQECRKGSPLFIAADQEGGRVQRFKKPFSIIPPMADIGLLDSPKLCFELASVIAKELLACGVNINFSPCSDILSNPSNKVIGDRAFGSTEEAVSKFVTAFVRGFQVSKLISCVKHFPGHGGTTKDSHFDLPYVKTSLSDLEKNEFGPFSKAIKSKVDFVMMAHLMVDAIDPDTPISLSKKAYDLVKKEFKFKKLFVTDDMNMKAITDRYSIEKAAVMAIKAGADIIEYREIDSAKAAIAGLYQAYDSGELPDQLINEKLDKINSLKDEYLSDFKPIYIPEITPVFESADSKEVMEKINFEIEQKKKLSS